MAINTQKIIESVQSAWRNGILSELEAYIRIPCKSVAFDPDWEKNGFIDQAVEHMVSWTLAQNIKGLSVQVERLPNLTPLIYIEIAGCADETILMYGHLDKQPEMTGWEEGLGPWIPVIKNNRLYGRGGADDGYALYASLTAIKALQEQGIAHARMVLIVEACEESGSAHLPAYFQYLKARIGNPSLVICLDSGAGNYEQLWSTTSLRGLVGGTLTIEFAKEGMHSGAASGVLPSTFRIMRELLSRVENEKTGEILVTELQATIPPQRLTQIKKVAHALGDAFKKAYPHVEGGCLMSDSVEELILNRSWRATLSVTGISDIPAVTNAGNVLRPKTTLKLSFRISPTSDCQACGHVLKKIFETDPPYGARVNFDPFELAHGWHAPLLSDWLAQASEEASMKFFGKSAMYFGEGGTIPFMGMLGEQFPNAQFLITGVLGPHSNAHGPNEFLDIPFAEKLTACVAYVVARHSEVMCGTVV